MEISMKISNTLAASCLLLFSLNVNADIASDIIDGKSMAEIFSTALDTGSSLEDIFSQIQQADQNLLPSATTHATCQKLDTPESVTGFAFLAIPDDLKGTVIPPATVSDLVRDVANAAIDCGLDRANLAAPALAGGVDPTGVQLATAAGGPAPGAGGAGVAGTGAPISTPGVSGVTGGGGGNTASAI